MPSSTVGRARSLTRVDRARLVWLGRAHRAGSRGGQSPRPLPDRASRPEMPVPGHQIPGPHRARQNTMDHAMETRAQRVRHHLRRPLAGTRDLLKETAGNTVGDTVPRRSLWPTRATGWSSSGAVGRTVSRAAWDRGATYPSIQVAAAWGKAPFWRVVSDQSEQQPRTRQTVPSAWAASRRRSCGTEGHVVNAGLQDRASGDCGGGSPP